MEPVLPDLSMRRHGIPVKLRAWVLSVCLGVLAVGCRTPGPPMRPARPALSGIAVLESASRACVQLRFERLEEFEGERLYDYMNGAAVTYLQQGFRVLAACDVFLDNTQAKVELFDMGTASRANAIFAEFVTATGRPLDVGEQGRYWPGAEPEGIFVRGRFFVRVLAYAEDAQTAETVTAAVAACVDQAAQRVRKAR